MNILKSKLVPTGALSNTKKTAIALTAVMASSSAMAEGGASGGLPAAATAAMGQVSAFADSMIAQTWPIVITVTLAVIGIGLFKKFSKKAVS